jgi:hypothetical protein
MLWAEPQDAQKFNARALVVNSKLPSPPLPEAAWIAIASRRRRAPRSNRRGADEIVSAPLDNGSSVQLLAFR